MHIHVSTGKGEGPTPLAAFDAALYDAGVANYNLICLSSVIPPTSVIERVPLRAAPDDYGDRLYVVLARQQEEQPGKAAWAGLGWIQDVEDGRGLFVECTGGERGAVEANIEATLTSMIPVRGAHFGPIHAEVAGIECRGRPVCALVIAAYHSEGWNA